MFCQIHHKGALSARILLICMLFIIGGCSGTIVGNPDVDTVANDAVSQFESQEELEEYLKEQYAASVLSYGTRDYAVQDIAPGLPTQDTDTAGSNESDDFSGTNIQERGVDESDKVKTDGAYIYVAGQQKVTIVRAMSSTGLEVMKVIGDFSVKGSIDSLYLHDNILVVLYIPLDGSGTGSADVVGIGMPYWIPVKAQTAVLLMDVSDPSAPSRIKEIVADGYFISSRLTGGKLHIVQQFLPDLPDLQWYYDGTDGNRTEVIAANKKELEPLSLDDMLPSWAEIDDLGDTVPKGLLVTEVNFYHPEEPGGGSIVTVMTIPMDDLSQPVQSAGIVADVHQIYSSTRGLYLTATRWRDSIVTPDSDITIASNSDNWQTTIIHKFDLTREEVVHAGSGRVKGRILNQFSLGEYEDVLRIATTTGETWTGASQNHLFCLKEGEKGLSVIGSIENIAPGERIYSARFMGTRGFLVTFVQVDPLFTLDLSDPTHPRVAGELKVPGYSDYIHLLGENHLLTIGRDVMVQNGAVYFQGLRLSIFDITDFANPILAYPELIGDRVTYSEALYNHKAFTFWPANNLLAFPIEGYGSQSFTGLYVYEVTTDSGFKRIGSISTLPDSQPEQWDGGWTRGLFIEDYVYAVKSQAIWATPWEDIDPDVDPLLIEN